MKIGVIYSPKMLVDCHWIICCYIPEDRILHRSDPTQSVSWPRVKPGTSQIQVRRITVSANLIIHCLNQVTCINNEVPHYIISQISYLYSSFFGLYTRILLSSLFSNIIFYVLPPETETTFHSLNKTCPDSKPFSGVSRKKEIWCQKLCGPSYT
jgi:hypothetical protein